MIDIGLNLFDKQFKNKHEILKESMNAGVKKIILTGTSMRNNELNVKFIKENPKYKNFLYSTVGIHPHNADFFKEEDLKEMKVLLNEENVVAVGECGLDYNRMRSTKENQILCLEKQIELSKEIKKPLFLHERDAIEDFISIFDNEKSVCENSVIHCFTSNKENLKKYLERGFYIGITGWVTDEKRGKELQEAVKYIPLDKLMIETDGPYLMPKNIINKPRHRVNDSRYLEFVNKKLSEILNIKEAELAIITEENTKKFFNLK